MNTGFSWIRNLHQVGSFILFLSCLFNVQENPGCLSCEKRNIFRVLPCWGKGEKGKLVMYPGDHVGPVMQKEFRGCLCKRAEPAGGRRGLQPARSGARHLLPNNARISVLFSSFHSSPFEATCYGSPERSVQYQSPTYNLPSLTIFHKILPNALTCQVSLSQTWSIPLTLSAFPILIYSPRYIRIIYTKYPCKQSKSSQVSASHIIQPIRRSNGLQFS